MRIVTTFAPPPIPVRHFDWSAVDLDSYDPDPETRASRLIGWGETEEAAITDLLNAMEDDGSPIEREDAREYRAANGQFGVGA